MPTESIKQPAKFKHTKPKVTPIVTKPTQTSVIYETFLSASFNPSVYPSLLISEHNPPTSFHSPITFHRVREGVREEEREGEREEEREGEREEKREGEREEEGEGRRDTPRPNPQTGGGSGAHSERVWKQS
ncbi:hypothetical protein PoB_001599200 [Plakobranchus ocellatus]|uniref:Uncharacterized protein n=1 Tax=Plakobranchus ocellatus TaxID=259542 RepID=A0AAV3Z4K6_9GAST|nr:hypothetical protein PoB_001599200 [Plakobranchus ocellatus]